MALLITAYLLIVFLLPLLIGGVATLRALPRGRTCALCRGSTLRVASRGERLVRRFTARLERRWCPDCRWEGYVRVQAAETLPAPPTPAAGDAAPGPALALDVRTLRLDGGVWRVQLQWWRERQRCQGRMVFIAPSGQHLRDGVHCFSGTTQFEVLGQALSIPDRLLVNRVRQLLTASDR